MFVLTFFHLIRILSVIHVQMVWTSLILPFDNYVVVENEGAVEVCVVLTVPLTTATEVFIVPRTTGSAIGGARVTFVYQNFTCNFLD